MSLTATQNEPTQASWIVTHLHYGSPSFALYIPITSKRAADGTNMHAMSVLSCALTGSIIPAQTEEEIQTNFLDFDSVLCYLLVSKFRGKTCHHLRV